MFGLFSGKTISERMIETRGRTSGFDYLRIFLACAVVLSHAWEVSNVEDAGFVWSGLHGPLTVAVLPMFFALSGFLVTGSLQRSRSLVEFLTLRAVRLVPALFVEVMLFAYIFGPLLTQFSLSDYFSDKKFWMYHLNIIGEVQFKLPGLFLNNPVPEIVNHQLWTLPSELGCYATLAILSALGLVFRKKMLAPIFFAATAAAIFYVYNFKDPSYLLRNTVSPYGLVLSFLAGVVMYVYGKEIVLNKAMFGIAVIILYFTLLYKPAMYFAFLPAAYVTVYLGLLNPRKTFINATGDYSYGVYLYGYPMQQIYSYLFPEYRLWWMNFIFALLVSGVCAALSWTFIESRAMEKRNDVVQFNLRLYNSLRGRVLRRPSE